MRIWDIHPGYLNRQSLLGEHRELHGLVNIITQGKKGYSRHPETVRWVGFGWALKQRHALLAAEMALRGYRDQSPVRTRSTKDLWPTIFIDTPRQQFHLLNDKYEHKAPGRIPLPLNAQQLWGQHKYSLLARDPNRYKTLGREVAKMNPEDDFENIALELTLALRSAPSVGGLTNALQHMWGYVSKESQARSKKAQHGSLKKLLAETQGLALATEQTYLLHSTALSEFKVYIENLKT
ncbi:DUF1722 domain-containing protein [Pseudomonadota bacterium]